MRTEPLRRALPGLLALLLLGCPGTLEDKERFLTDGGGDGGGCGDVPARIFQPSCGGTGCHGSRSPQQGLDLESPGVAARVVGTRAQVCTGILADPQDPAGSLLYTKLLENAACGSRMPLARTPLGLADIECVRAWIGTQGQGGTSGTSAADGARSR